MRTRSRPLLRPTLALLLAALAACGNKAAVDPKNREVPWTYGPTTGGATVEHVQGAGKKEGTPAVARGWNCRLQDGKRLTVRPYELTSTHPLFGKVALSVGLFDKTGKQLAMLRSEPITAQNATFTFDVEEAVAKELLDAVLWYVKV